MMIRRKYERAAAGELRRILEENPVARRRWTILAAQRDLRVLSGEINKEAVRQYLVEWAEEHGEISEDALDEPGRRPGKDRIYRALAGKQMSPETLRWFIEGFELDDETGEKLRGLMSGETDIRYK